MNPSLLPSYWLISKACIIKPLLSENKILSSRNYFLALNNLWKYFFIHVVICTQQKNKQTSVKRSILNKYFYHFEKDKTENIVSVDKL